ncbi:MAG: hypothetical protein KJ823_03455, partial [Proteobacteria bacterium]|nr:hypothetical protein [Pseudomonadota bacterium]
EAVREWLFPAISASGSDFNPQNTQCIPAVKIFAFLDLAKNFSFSDSLLGQIQIQKSPAQNRLLQTRRNRQTRGNRAPLIKNENITHIPLLSRREAP